MFSSSYELSGFFNIILWAKDHITPLHTEEGILSIGLFDFLLNENCLNW